VLGVQLAKQVLEHLLARAVAVQDAGLSAGLPVPHPHDLTPAAEAARHRPAPPGAASFTIAATTVGRRDVVAGHVFHGHHLDRSGWQVREGGEEALPAPHQTPDCVRTRTRTHAHTNALPVVQRAAAGGGGVPQEEAGQAALVVHLRVGAALRVDVQESGVCHFFKHAA
jgi:hypothetical protein